MKKRGTVIFFACTLLLGAFAILAYSFYMRSPNRNMTLVFSQNEMLSEMWTSYKQSVIEASTGRTVDRSQDNITTSEAESYTMLRAVWMDDKSTFDQSFSWTNKFLKRSDDLFSWKYGPTTNGHYGIQTAQGGENTASDADSDIALALLMAYSRWNNPTYLAEAKPIIANIWKEEVVTVAGKPVLTADNLEHNNRTSVTVNPSYFAPYSYKLFAKVDPSHDWIGLANNSYTILANLSTSKLTSNTASGLPPDWIVMNRTTGALSQPQGSQTTNYGYDAMRIPWRLALDWEWNQDPRDKQLLSSFSFLEDQWNEDGKLASTYAHDGTTIGNYESPAMYGTAMGYFLVMQPSTAKDIYTQKLESLYSPDKQTENSNLTYYDANWSWFGIALYQHALPNIAVE